MYESTERMLATDNPMRPIEDDIKYRTKWDVMWDDFRERAQQWGKATKVFGIEVGYILVGLFGVFVIGIALLDLIYIIDETITWSVIGGWLQWLFSTTAMAWVGRILLGLVFLFTTLLCGALVLACLHAFGKHLISRVRR